MTSVVMTGVMMTDGDDALFRFEEATDWTMHYLEDMGAKVAAAKSYAFASDDALRHVIRVIQWAAISTKLEVVVGFRYLGAQVSTGSRMAKDVIDARLERATRMAERLAKLSIG